MSSKVTKTSSDTGKKRILPFLRELLADEKMVDIIVWVDEDQQIFKMIKPKEVASKWGKATNNFMMNYENMSRSLRYLYTTNTIKKCSGKDFKYQFLEPASSTPSPTSSSSKKCSGKDFKYQFLEPTSSTSNSPPQPLQPIQLVPVFPVLQFAMIPLVGPSVPGPSAQIDASSGTFNIDRFLSGGGSENKNPNNSCSNTSNKPSSPTTSSSSSDTTNAPPASIRFSDLVKFRLDYYFYLNNPHLLPKQQ